MLSENAVQDVYSWTAQAQRYGPAAGAAEPWAAGAPPRPEGDELWCRIVEHADGYTMQFGGRDRAALEARLASLRGAIPAQRRRWNAVTRMWWIDPVVERMLRSLSRWATRSFSPAQVQRSSDPA